MNVIDKLVTDMPDVQENAISQLQAEGAEPELVDSLGRTFDAFLHRTDATGNPILTNKGKLRIKPKPGGGASKPKSASSIGGVDSQSEPDFSYAKEEAAIIATGQSAAALTFVIGMAIFGADGAPSNDEKEQITYAYQTYFKAKNIQDLPPGIVLVTALATYALPRALKPANSKKFSGWYGKVKGAVTRDRTPKSPPETEAK